MTKRTEADRNHERYNLLRGRLRSMFLDAIRGHWTHTRIIEERTKRVLDTPEYRKLTQAYAFGLTAIAGEWFDIISRDYMDWRMGPESGPTRFAHVDPWTDADSELCRTKNMFGGHFWKGTDIPYNGYTRL